MNTPVPPPPPSDGTPPPPPPNYGQVPPPPGAVPPPPGAVPPPGGPPPGTPPAYAPYTPGGFTEKPPRPEVKIAAGMIVVGAILSIIGVYLPWVTLDGDSQNGTGVFITSDFTIFDNPGSIPLVMSVIVGGLGIALFFAGRVLAVAIIAIVATAIAFFIGIGMAGIAADTADISGDGSIGVGAVIQPIAPLLGLAGSIWATAKRRR